MAKYPTWSEIVDSDKFQKMTPEEKQQLREEFFEFVIAPEMGTDENLKNEFFQEASKIEEKYYNKHGKPTDKIILPVSAPSFTKEELQLLNQEKPKPTIETAGIYSESGEVTTSPKSYADVISTETNNSYEKYIPEKEPKKTLEEIQEDGKFWGKLQEATRQGILHSTTAEMLDTASKYFPEGNFVQRFFEENKKPDYVPQGKGLTLAYDLSSILSDLALFKGGGALGGRSAGAISNILASKFPKLAKFIPYATVAGEAAGTFAFPEGLRETAISLKDKDLSLQDVEDIAYATGKGAVEGLIFTGAGNAAKWAAKTGTEKLLKSNLLANIAGWNSKIAAQTGVLLSFSPEELSLENAERLLLLNFTLEAAHAVPDVAKRVAEISQASNIPAERILFNLTPEQIKFIKSSEDADRIVTEAYNKTKQQIELETIDKAQKEVISKQIEANFKEGKPIEEIIVKEQLPENVRPLFFNEDGSLRPEVVEKTAKILKGEYPEYVDTVKNVVNSRVKNENKLQILQELEAKKEKALQEQEFYKNLYETYLSQERPQALEQYKKLYLDQEITKIPEGQEIPESVYLKAEQKANKRISRDDEQYLAPLKEIKKELETLSEDIETIKQISQIQERPVEEIKKDIDLALSKIRDSYREEMVKSGYFYKKILGEEQWKTESERQHFEDYKIHYKDFYNFLKKPKIALEEEIKAANKITKPAGKLMNASRVIEEMGLTKTFTEPIRTAKLLAQIEQNKLLEKIQNSHKLLKTELKTSGKKLKQAEREILLYLYSRQPDAQAGLKKILKKNEKIPTWESLSEAQKKFIENIDNTYAEIFERINTARELVGLEPLKKVKDYFTLVRVLKHLEDIGFNIYSVEQAIIELNIMKAEKGEIVLDSPSFQYGKERVRNSSEELSTDLMDVINRYISSSSKVIYNTPIIKKLSDALEVIKENQGQEYNYSILRETLNYVAGEKVSKINSRLNNIINFLHGSLVMSTLPFNFNTILVQPTSISLAIPFTGTKYIAEGFRDFLTPEMRKWAEKNSRVLKTRIYHDASIAETLDFLKNSNSRKVLEKIRKAEANVAEIGLLPVKYLDYFAAEVVWFAGYRFARTNQGLNHTEAVSYADKLVVQTQGSAERIDLAPMQYTPLGKFFTTFQTFSINQFNLIRNDLLNRKGKIYTLAEKEVSEQRAKEYREMDQEGFKYIIKPLGDGKYNIFTLKNPASKIEITNKIAKTMLAMAVANTVMQGLGYMLPKGTLNTASPFPDPVNAFMKGMYGQSFIDMIYGQDPSKEEVDAIDGVIAALKDVANIVPIIGGSAQYGGKNLGGAPGALMIDIMDSIAERPGSKELGFLISKCVGFPGATQLRKSLVVLRQERIKRRKEENKKPLQSGYEYIFGKKKSKKREKDAGIWLGGIQEILGETD